LGDFLFVGEIQQAFENVRIFQPNNFRAKIGDEIDVIEKHAKIRCADFCADSAGAPMCTA